MRRGAGLFSFMASDAGVGKVRLSAGDQLVAVAGVSLVDCEDPFERAVALIQANKQRPITLRFLAQATPGP